MTPVTMRIRCRGAVEWLRQIVSPSHTSARPASGGPARCAARSEQMMTIQNTLARFLMHADEQLSS